MANIALDAKKALGNGIVHARLQLNLQSNNYYLPGKAHILFYFLKFQSMLFNTNMPKSNALCLIYQ